MILLHTTCDANNDCAYANNAVNQDLMLKLHGWNNKNSSESDDLDDNNIEKMRDSAKNVSINQVKLEALNAREENLAFDEDYNDEDATQIEIEYDVDCDES